MNSDCNGDLFLIKTDYVDDFLFSLFISVLSISKYGNEKAISELFLDEEFQIKK